MNTHKHARLTYVRRLEMTHDLKEHKFTVAQAAGKYGVSEATVRKWQARFLAEGAEGLMDRSSKPHRSPRQIEPQLALTIVQLRLQLMLQAHIAAYLGICKATVSRVLKRAGLSKLSDLRPSEPIKRYEHDAPGDLLHIDIKRLGRIERPGHRVSGTRQGRKQGAGWEFLFVAVDDHTRIAFTQMYPNEQKDSAVSFLEAASAYYAQLGVTIKRLITDNGSAFRSKDFVKKCAQLNIRNKFTRPYRPQTNGKAERFIQSAIREWAYGHKYEHSDQRTAALPSWNHYYNCHRIHHGIHCKTPISRLLHRNNLLQHDT